MISVLTPTRHRPKQLERMVESLRKVSSKEPEVVVYIDDDDSESIKKVETLGIKYRVGPRLVFTDYWNKCYELATGNILMMGADDLLFRTQNWDTMVEEAFAQYPDHIVMVYGNDLHIRMAIPSHPLVHRRWIEVVGYFSPPWFTCGACDVWLNEIAKFLDRKHFIRFVAEHMHPTVGKSEVDETYWERLIPTEERDKSTALYAELFLERLRDAEKLKAEIDRYDFSLTTNP